KLEYLGLRSAAAIFCTELSDRQKVKIDFCSENVPRDLPEEISICLFRVLQEALQNAIKHSGSQQIQVSLSVELNEIRLTVRDSGAGFDPKGAMKAQDRKSTRLNSSHLGISYAVFCLKKKKKDSESPHTTTTTTKEPNASTHLKLTE